MTIAELRGIISVVDLTAVRIGINVSHLPKQPNEAGLI